jgi:hypothetical protein
VPPCEGGPAGRYQRGHSISHRSASVRLRLRVRLIGDPNFAKAKLDRVQRCNDRSRPQASTTLRAESGFGGKAHISVASRKFRLAGRFPADRGSRANGSLGCYSDANPALILSNN